MKRYYLFLIGMLMCTIASAQFDSAPAFPGAEGHGRYVTGGRGGEVRHVTNLNDSGTGSFRAAVNGSTKKIVVFDVAGVIALNSDLTIGANTTILGQTAPGDGITLRYYTVKYNSGGNIIMRYIRIRRGQEKDVNDGADAATAKECSNIILDHCSFSWSIDEVASFYDNKNFTMQWCTIGEPLKYAGHDKGAHGYGGIWGGKGASFHHNLLIHLDNRAPRLNGARFFWQGPNDAEYPDVETCIAAEKVDFRNCVIYNTGTGNGAYGGMGGNHNIVNNYYKAGPATRNKTRVFQCSVTNSTDGIGTKNANFPAGIWGKFYINGNYVSSASTPANYDWNGVTIDKCNDSDVTTPSKDQLKIAEVEKGYVTTHTAVDAYEKVLTYAGASKVKDCIDTRYAREVRNNAPECVGSATSYTENGTQHTVSSHPKGIIDVTADALKPHGGEYTLNGGTKETDTDGDGIPDAWEDVYGLDKNNKEDATAYTIDSRKYYTNIEVYANYLVEEITRAERADATDSFEEYYPLSDSDSGNKYIIAANTKVEAGTEVAKTDIKMVYGNDNSWALAKKDATNAPSGYEAYIAGSANPSPADGKVPTTGCFYKFEPSSAGTLSVAILLNQDKKLYVVENETSIAYKLDGESYPAGSILKVKKGLNLSFDVVGGRTYYVYCSSSKLGLYGFEFTPATSVVAVKFYNNDVLYDDIKVVDGGDFYAPVTPTRENYLFNGWSKTENGTQTEAFPITASNDMNFYAVWEIDPSYIASGIHSVFNNSDLSPAYNLNGQRVSMNQKGIIVVNGRKILNR